MKKYTDLKQEVKKIAEINSELKDSKISLLLNMLKSTEKRIEKLGKENMIDTNENKFYIRAYIFYLTACTIRLNLLNGVFVDSYEIPGFNTWEDLDHIFDGFTDKLTVIIYSEKYELPERSSGSYTITENNLKVAFANSSEELVELKKDNSITLHITNSDLW